MKFRQIERLKSGAGLVGCDTRAFDGRDIELEIHDVVFTVQERADHFLVGQLAFEFRMDFVIRRRRQGEYAVESVRICFNRSTRVGLGVTDENTGARQRLAAEIQNEAMDVLRLGTLVASSGGKAELAVGRQSY